MTRSPIIAVDNHEDFEQVYDLPDPRSYYRALAPLDYRAPALITGFLRRHYQVIAKHRDADRLALLDLCSGYGANGALLKHRLDLAGLFAFYDGDGAGSGGDDRDFFAGQAAREDCRFEIAGLDIAEVALAYARRCGLIDHLFTDNLVTAAPSPGLRDFLRRSDLVIETGGIGAIMVDCCRRILQSLETDRGPWFLLCPRPDWDHEPLWQVFEDAGYRSERVSGPLLYRRTMASEHKGALARTAATGRDPDAHFRDGYYLISMMLARPEADCQDLPAEALRFEG